MAEFDERGVNSAPKKKVRLQRSAGGSGLCPVDAAAYGDRSQALLYGASVSSLALFKTHHVLTT